MEGETKIPTAQDISAELSTDVIIIGEYATVMETAKIKSDQRIGLSVVGRREKLVGIFTERHVLNRVVARHRDPLETIVKYVMTTSLACCPPADSDGLCQNHCTTITRSSCESLA